MSLLTRPAPPSEAASSTVPLSSPLALGGLAAVQAVVGSLLCLIAPVLAVWIASTRTAATWGEAVRIAADVWLLAHHTGIAVDGGHVALTPLGLTAVPAAWCWIAGRRMATALGAPSGPVAPPGSGRRALVVFAAVYALLAAVVSLLAASPVARPISGQALLGGFVLAAVTCGAAMLRAARATRRPVPWAAVGAQVRAPAVRRVLPAVGVALAAWLAAGNLVLLAGLVSGWDGILAAHRALGAGPVGGVGLALAQVAFVPVAVVWGAAWATGPGFAVGAETVVNPWVADLGALPAFPMLGALPSGAMPTPVQLVLLVPVLTGVLAGLWLRRHRPAPAGTAPWWRRPVVDGATCGLLTGAGAGLLSWLASGPAGPGRMSVVGPDPALVALVVAVEVAVGCVVVLALPRRGGQPVGRRVPRLAPPSWLRSSIHRS